MEVAVHLVLMLMVIISSMEIQLIGTQQSGGTQWMLIGVMVQCVNVFVVDVGICTQIVEMKMVMMRRFRYQAWW